MTPHELITDASPEQLREGDLSPDENWIFNGKDWVTRYASWRGKLIKTKEDFDNMCSDPYFTITNALEGKE